MQISNITANNSVGNTTTISMIAGEAGAIPLTINVAGSPLNLTSYSAKMQINFPVPVLFSTANGDIVITNAGAGQLQINITTSQTEQPSGTYSYDFWLTNGSGSPAPWLSGNFILSPSNTPIP